MMLTTDRTEYAESFLMGSIFWGGDIKPFVFIFELKISVFLCDEGTGIVDDKLHNHIGSMVGYFLV
jgi:hypothetical protein